MATKPAIESTVKLAIYAHADQLVLSAQTHAMPVSAFNGEFGCHSSPKSCGIDNTISPRDSQVGSAGKIIWLYRGLVITGFTRKSLYSMKLFIFD